MVLKKLLDINPRDWHIKLKYALWEDRIRTKNALGMSPFQFVYGIESVFPLQLKIGILQFMQDYIELDDTLEA